MVDGMVGWSEGKSCPFVPGYRMRSVLVIYCLRWTIRDVRHGVTGDMGTLFPLTHDECCFFAQIDIEYVTGNQ